MERLECHDWDVDGYPGEFVYGDDVYVDDYYMEERWKRVEDHPEYWVSDRGRIYGPSRWHDGDFLDQTLQDGYYKVTLSHNGNKKDERVNRLVAKAFVPNTHNKPLVMHMDNDRTNNEAVNLQWGTYAENNQYCWDCGRHPMTLTDDIREKAMQTRRTPIAAINIETGEELIFRSQHDAARALGVMQQHIYGVLKGNRRSTGGYRFKYVDKEAYRDGNY